MSFLMTSSSANYCLWPLTDPSYWDLPVLNETPCDPNIHSEMAPETMGPICSGIHNVQEHASYFCIMHKRSLYLSANISLLCYSFKNTLDLNSKANALLHHRWRPTKDRYIDIFLMLYQQSRIAAWLCESWRLSSCVQWEWENQY